MTVTCNTGSQGRRAKTLSRALDADSEAAPVRRAAGERGRRSIAELGERLQRLRFVRTLLPAIERLLHPRARARSVRAREDGSDALLLPRAFASAFSAYSHTSLSRLLHMNQASAP